LSNPSNRCIVLDRLASLAVQDVYHEVVADSKIQICASDTSSQQDSSSLVSEWKSVEQLARQIDKLLAQLDLPPMTQCPRLSAAAGVDPHVFDERLNHCVTALKCVETRVSTIDCKQTHKPNLNLPVGFDPGSSLHPYTVVLRLLHGNELRTLQDRLNIVVAQLQAITADPKTNTRLGKVGR